MPFPHSHPRSLEGSNSNWYKKAFIPLEDPDPSTDHLSGKTAREGGLSSTTHSISLSPTSRPKVAWYNSDENDVEKTSVSHVGTVAVDSRGEEDGDHSDMSIRLRRLFYWGFLCPPLWLLGFIMYTFRFFPGRLVSSHSDSPAMHSHLRRIRITEKKYATWCLYAFLISFVTFAGIGVIVWAVVVLNRFGKDVERISVGTFNVYTP